MQGNNKGLSYLPLIVIVLLLIGTVGFLSLQSNSENTNNTDIKVTETPTPDNVVVTPNPNVVVVTPTPDPLSDWNTYQNKKYGYEFKYPTEAKINENSDEYVGASYMGEKQKATGRTQTELFDGYSFNVVNMADNGYEDLDDFFNQKVDQLKDVCTEIGDPKETTVSGKRAITHRLSCLGDFDTYYVLNKDQYFEISLLYVGDAEDLPNYTKTVNQILSTFEFVE